MHALIECSFAKSCWFSSPVGFVGYCTSFFGDCNIAMMICWRIWIHRNDIIWNNKISSVQQVLNSAGQLLYQWQVAKKQVYYVDDDVHRLAHGAVSWERPKFGWVKCNVDAVVFESQRRIGFGCVLCNSDGCFLATRCAGRPGIFRAREAEALSIQEAFSWLKELQLPCVIVEMDCLQVFQALTEGFSGPNGFGLIIEECRKLAIVIGEVKFSFIRRFANFAAQAVARAVSSMSDSRVWSLAPPFWLLNSL
ncbi:putative reverse transcriptase/RNA-dependent DNA polymerase [Citrus sinensis]|uniref:Reverse transcriptase/RNA-dependent DNA polymerase n=1 Tax=Citrus sinensis TaxID=2711 RepID=A0ACB8L8K5_CITSI|nr:putative reverse transcriptase/RNA-dependent DNA polymerase [Citrus sinensis]